MHAKKTHTHTHTFMYSYTTMQRQRHVWRRKGGARAARRAALMPGRGHDAYDLLSVCLQKCKSLIEIHERTQTTHTYILKMWGVNNCKVQVLSCLNRKMCICICMYVILVSPAARRPPPTISRGFVTDQSLYGIDESRGGGGCQTSA